MAEFFSVYEISGLVAACVEGEGEESFGLTGRRP